MLCLTTIMILVEIILRRFFNSSLYFTDEFTGYFLCGIVMMGMAITLRDGSHIKMTALYEFLPEKYKLILNKIIDFVGLIFCIYLTSVTYNLFWRSVLGKVRSMGVSKTYIAIPQFFIPLGFLIMAFQFLEKIYNDFYEKI